MINDDPTWPRATSLLVSPSKSRVDDVGLLGGHTYRTSVTPRSSLSTPRAVREALRYYSTWNYADELDLVAGAKLVDYGDVVDADADDSDWSSLRHSHPLWILLGGDNALTWRALSVLAGSNLSEWGLLTLDAHHDLRDGRSNGSPVRQLLDAGLDPAHVVQVGIADFANSSYYADRARRSGIRVITRGTLSEGSLENVVASALAELSSKVRHIYVDVDLDVMDRTVVPGCPAAVPGGLSVVDVRRAVRLAANHHLVSAVDFTEVDVERDAPDGRTVRTVALLLLEALSGYQRRTP